MLAAGRLNKRITILHRATAEQSDSYGQPQDDWIVFAERWAAVEPLQGREFFESQQTQAQVTTRFRLRYLPGVTPAMRISYEGREYDIQSVIDPEERHRELVIMALERK